MLLAVSNPMKWQPKRNDPLAPFITLCGGDVGPTMILARLISL